MDVETTVAAVRAESKAEIGQKEGVFIITCHEGMRARR